MTEIDQKAIEIKEKFRILKAGLAEYDVLFEEGALSREEMEQFKEKKRNIYKLQVEEIYASLQIPHLINKSNHGVVRDVSGNASKPKSNRGRKPKIFTAMGEVFGASSNTSPSSVFSNTGKRKVSDCYEDSNSVSTVNVNDISAFLDSDLSFHTDGSQTCTDDSQYRPKKSKLTPGGVSNARLQFDSEDIFHKPLPKKMYKYPKQQTAKIEEDVHRPDFPVKLQQYVNIIGSLAADSFAKGVAVQEVHNIANLGMPPIRLLCESGVMKALMRLAFRGKSQDLTAKAIRCIYSLLNLDETRDAYLKVILSFNPMVSLVEMVSANDTYDQEGAIQLLNTIGLTDVPLLLHHGVLEAVLREGETCTESGVIHQVVKIVKNMLKDARCLSRMVREDTVKPLLNIVAKALRVVNIDRVNCLESGTAALHSVLVYARSTMNESLLWDDVSSLMQHPTDGLVGHLVSMLDLKTAGEMGPKNVPMVTRLHAATSLAHYLSFCDRLDISTIMERFHPMDVLLKNLTRLKPLGTCSKELPGVVSCLSLLCGEEEHRLTLKLAVFNGLGAERFLKFLASYRDWETKDRDLAMSAQTLSDLCDGLWAEGENTSLHPGILTQRQAAYHMWYNTQCVGLLGSNNDDRDECEDGNGENEEVEGGVTPEGTDNGEEQEEEEWTMKTKE